MVLDVEMQYTYTQHYVLPPENADNAVVTGLVSTMKTELLATSSSGQLKLWDLRTPSVETPSRIMVM